MSTSPRAVDINRPAAVVASVIVKAAACDFYGFFGHNAGATQYIQVHDSATVPADTAVPLHTFRVEANQNFSFDTGKFPIYLRNGFVLCNSSTLATKTIGSANCWLIGQYK